MLYEVITNGMRLRRRVDRIPEQIVIRVAAERSLGQAGLAHIGQTVVLRGGSYNFV